MSGTQQLAPGSVAIDDPDFYTNDPWPTFEAMQAGEGIYFHPDFNTFGVTRYKDIRDASVKPERFVSSRGIFLADMKFREQTETTNVVDSFFPEGGEHVGTADPPRHQELRRVIAPAFSLPAIDALQGPVVAHVNELIDGIEPGKPVEWSDIAGIIPINAACHLIGLPATDHARVQYWSDQLENLGGDLSYEEIQQAAKDFSSLQDYIVEAIEERKANPTGGLDLLTVLLNAEMDNRKVTQANVVTFSMTAMAAGSDTTRSLLNGIVDCFADNPDQWTHLRRNPDLIGNAVQEVLRWVAPARAFLRVAAEDCELNGQPIKAGQGLYFMYMAANRDKAAFVDPQRFDVTRKDANRHLALSSGPHLCAGMRLARMEAESVIEALLARFSRIERAGPPVRVRHVLRNGWESMPVSFVE